MVCLPAAPLALRRQLGLWLLVGLCLSAGKQERPVGERGMGRAGCLPLGDGNPPGHSFWCLLLGLRLGGSWLANHGGERWGPMSASSRRGEVVTHPG